MRRLALLAVLLAAPATAAPNTFSAQLLAMSPVARVTMFNQYMSAAQKTCGTIDRVFFQGSKPNGSDLWNVKCQEKTDWVVELAPNGKTLINDCAVAAARGAPCFVPLAKVKAAK